MMYKKIKIQEDHAASGRGKTYYLGFCSLFNTRLVPRDEKV